MSRWDTRELANVEGLARRLRETPDDQPGLAADRMNDLRVAMWEWEEAYARAIANDLARLGESRQVAPVTGGQG